MNEATRLNVYFREDYKVEYDREHFFEKGKRQASFRDCLFQVVPGFLAIGVMDDDDKLDMVYIPSDTILYFTGTSLS